MVAWPSTLPPPLRTVAVTPGGNVETADQASGRGVMRAWGHQPGDLVTVQFRIRQEQEGEFKEFWHRVGMDVTWFEAEWLSAMMYPVHKARLLGYPRRKGITNVWMDFAVTLLVMPAAFIPDVGAVPWFSAGTGTPPPPLPDELYFAVSFPALPCIMVWPLDEEEGVFGAKFSDPASPPTGGGFGTGVAFTPASDYIAVSHGVSPYISVYPWVNGFGAKASNPATLPAGTGNAVTFSPAGDYIAVGHPSPPYISVYPWTGAFGTKISNPVTTPTSGVNAIAFTPAGDYIAMANSTSPYVSVYPWTGAFGTKVTNPGTLPSGAAPDVTFSPDGFVIALANSNTPWISAYVWSAGFGTKYADSTPSMGSASGSGVHFSPDGNYIAGGRFGTPATSRIHVYPWVGGFGTKIADPEELPKGGVNGGVKFSPSGNYLAMAMDITPTFTIYAWTGAFGGKVSSPMTIPTPPTEGQDAAFGLKVGG